MMDSTLLLEVDSTEQTCKHYLLADGFLPFLLLSKLFTPERKGKSLWFLETGATLSQKATGSFFAKNWGNASKPLLLGYSAANKHRNMKNPE